MPFPEVPTGFAPSQVTSPIGTSNLDWIAQRYGLPLNTPVSVLMERLQQDPTYTYGDPNVVGASSGPLAPVEDRMAALQGATLNGVPLTDMIAQGQAYLPPVGAERDFYWSADNGTGGAAYTNADVASIRDDFQTRGLQGAARIGALVGGAAALGATPWGSAGGATGATGATTGGATTFPLASTGGTITATPIAAGAGTAAVPTVGGAAGALGSAGAAVPTAAGAAGNFINNWLPEITGGVNALLGYRAADQASDAEAAALQAAIEEQRRQYDTTRQDFMPWITAGTGALNRLQDPNANFMASPDYEFRRGEGIRDIGNTFSARGGAQSGNALRALAEFNSNLASGEFGNWWNRQAGLAGVGQAATGTVANAGQNTAANVGNYLAGQGVSRASGVMGKYGALAGGVNDIVGNYLYRRRLN